MPWIVGVPDGIIGWFGGVFPCALWGILPDVLVKRAPVDYTNWFAYPYPEYVWNLLIEAAWPNPKVVVVVLIWFTVVLFY